MTEPEKILFKKRLKQAGLAIIQERIDAAKKAIDEAQQSANQEEKSSAGDKYETGRAMGHLQKDMHSRQMAEQLKELGALQAIIADTLYSTATTGAFVRCAGACFFISAGLGKQMIEARQILFLSPQAPLARQMIQKKNGDHFLFNSVETRIEEVF
jgi:hypothetical protein